MRAEQAGVMDVNRTGSAVSTARSRKLGVLLWRGRIEDLTPAQLSELPCPVAVLN